MDAIRDADAAIAVACQREARVLFEGSFDAGQFFGMTKIILRHSIFPDEDPADQRLGADAEGQFELFAGEGEDGALTPVPPAPVRGSP